jgi:hypothetical protein
MRQEHSRAKGRAHRGARTCMGATAAQVRAHGASETVQAEGNCLELLPWWRRAARYSEQRHHDPVDAAQRDSALGELSDMPMGCPRPRVGLSQPRDSSHCSRPGATALDMGRTMSYSVQVQHHRSIGR